MVTQAEAEEEATRSHVAMALLFRLAEAGWLPILSRRNTSMLEIARIHSREKPA